MATKTAPPGHRLEIFYRDPGLDTRGELLCKRLKELGLTTAIHRIRLSEVYTLEGQFDRKRLREAAELLHNPVIHEVLIDRPRPLNGATEILEIGFLPGVTDNVAQTAAETLADAWGAPLPAGQGVYTSTIYYFESEGRLSPEDRQRIGRRLANPLIERLSWKRREEYETDRGMELVIPRVRLESGRRVLRIDLELPDAELIELGRKGIIDHYDDQGEPVRRGPLALDLPSLKAIAVYFREREKRAPTDLELEALAQTWSEHCKHTIFAAAIDEIAEGLYKGCIRKATEEIRRARGRDDICVSVFVDNSGAIVFDDEWLVTDKVETHNSPSALDPFGGAITGIVGVNRDTIGFGLGAKPIINRYGFCVADPNDLEPLFRDPEKRDQTLRPRRILDGIVDGVRVGGNCSGIPTTQGFLHFHPGYKGKPLVFVGTVGLIPRRTAAGRLSHEKAARPGDLIVVLGGRVGRDGIHGATFSSEALSAGSPATAVQIGDPITQKKFSDALIKEARDLDLYNSITDNGAGGISCSVAEMARECGGCRVELEKVPVKYAGMAPWEIWISESQERMTLAVPPDKWPQLKELLQRRGVEATVIGEFTDSGRCQVSFAGETVMDMELDFLHEGLPGKALKTRPRPSPAGPLELPPAAKLPWGELFTRLFSRLNLAAFDWVSHQYDFEVQGGSVLKPLVGSNRINGFASVVQPLPGNPRGVALSQSLYPELSELDAGTAAELAIDTAFRNLLAVGVPYEHIALLDNFCWCSSDDPERLWQLKQCALGCYRAAVAYGAPFISGKDSMYNDFRGYDKNGKPVLISVPPTILISAIGVVPDIARVRSFAFLKPGDELWLLGAENTDCNEHRLGGSEYLELLREAGLVAATAVGRAPVCRPAALAPFYRAFAAAVAQGAFRSICPVARGGLARAAGLGAMAEGCGFELEIPAGMRPDLFLFSESPGRFLISLDPHRRTALEALEEWGAVRLGEVRDGGKIACRQAGTELFTTSAAELERYYRAPFAGF